MKRALCQVPNRVTPFTGETGSNYAPIVWFSPDGAVSGGREGWRIVNLSGQAGPGLRAYAPRVGSDGQEEERRCQKHDVVDDAIERLEWDERKEDDTPFKRWRQLTRRTALTGGAAGIAAMVLEACGGSSSSSPSSARRPERRQQRSVDLRIEQGLQVHVRQPRDDEPVLHADAERRGGRVQAARLLVSVDRLADEQRRRDGQRDEQRGQRRRRRDRRRADRPACVQRTDDEGAGREDPGRRLQRRRGEQRPARLTSVRTCSCPVRRWAQHIASLVPSGDVALFIATPGSLNIQPRIDGAQDTLKSHSSIKTHVIATGAAVPAELTVIQSYATAHPNTKGYFAVDAGSTQGVAQTIQKQGLRGQGRQGRRLRPDPDHAAAARRRADRVHDRPAALPSGLLPDRRAVPVPRQSRR